jgi:hypothetical protein
MKTKHEPWTKFDPADLRVAPPYIKNPVPCPTCKGHVACIVTEDAYGVGQHFKYACSQCGGMSACGWVEAGSIDATCVHDFGNGVTVGNCLTTYTCSKCGTKQTIDSGG